MGNFKITVLFIALASVVASYSTASAYPFFSKSKLLKQLGAQILISEDQADALVFDKTILKDHNVPVDGRDTYLITSKGLVPMEGKTITKNLMQMCDNPYPGVGFKKTNGDGIFIATGKDLEGSISWYPAVASNAKSIHCFEGLVGGKAKYSSYKSKNLQGAIKQVRWGRKLSDQEIKTKCKEFADYNARLNPETQADDLNQDCLGGGYICKEEERLIVICETHNGECKEITNSLIDCDAMAVDGYNLNEFLGTLVIKSGSAQETWLIWNAPGYEGQGVYAIEINDLGKKEKPSEEWLVYNGC